MFSPRYYRARRRDPSVDPDRFCALNVALRSGGRDRWVMSEFAASATHRDADAFTLGRSRIRAIDGGGLEIDLDERTAPWRRKLVGRVRLMPRTSAGSPRALESSRQHCWWPIAPLADVEVELDEPDLRFKGSGYHDANFGTEPMEAAMKGWNWARTETEQGAEISYDVETTDGSLVRHGILHRPSGTWSAPPDGALQPQSFSRTGWGIDRQGRFGGGGRLERLRTLLDSPFYARSLVSSADGTGPHAIHEAIRLDRFEAWTTRALLPFKMRGGW